MTEKLTWHFEDNCNFKYIDFSDKDSLVKYMIMTMLQRTNSMFDYENLPSTIPRDVLESMLQQNGYAGIIEHEGKLFCVYGGVGGIRNYNYQPSKLIVSNPYLLIESQAYDIYYGKDSEISSPLKDNLKTVGKCVIIQNDNLYTGILPLCQYYASQLAENVISKRLVTILSRAMYVFTAGDTDIKDDFMDFIKDITNGELSCVLAEGILGDGAHNCVNTLPLAEKGHEALTNLIEDQQYIKASWFNDLGLQANYNMKRESINSNESQLNKDAVLPFVDNMLNMRKLGVKRVNELFGTNITVDFSSAWKYTRQTIDQAIEAIDETTQIDSNLVEKNESDDANQLAEKGGSNE